MNPSPESNDVRICPPADLLLDDFGRDDLISEFATRWRGFSDRVMGGVSQENVALTEIHGRRCLRLTGDVCLDNDGGFIQMALDLAPDGATLDGSTFRGLLVEIWGNRETYGLHLRTADCIRPWQSYRASFVAKPRWQDFKVPFPSFAPHRLATPLDIRRLRRLGLVAIGRPFEADLAVARLALYAEAK